MFFQIKVHCYGCLFGICVSYADADSFVFGDDDFAMTDKNVIGVNIYVVVDIPVQLDNGSASQLQQLVDPEVRGSQRDGNFNHNIIIGKCAFLLRRPSNFSMGFSGVCFFIASYIIILNLQILY